MRTLDSEKVQRKLGFKSLFAALTLQTFLYKIVSAFFLEPSISENMGHFKGTRVYFNIIVSKSKTFFAIKYVYLA